MSAALVVGEYYRYDTDHQVDGYSLTTTGLIGAGFGAGAKAVDKYGVLQYVKQHLK